MHLSLHLFLSSNFFLNHANHSVFWVSKCLFIISDLAKWNNLEHELSLALRTFEKLYYCSILWGEGLVRLIIEDPMHEEILFKDINIRYIDAEYSATTIIVEADISLATIIILNNASHVNLQRRFRVLTLVNTLCHWEKGATFTKLANKLKLNEEDVSELSFDQKPISSDDLWRNITYFS